jgi:thioredoxin-like negative regulator of GroEL
MGGCRAWRRRHVDASTWTSARLVPIDQSKRSALAYFHSASDWVILVAATMGDSPNAANPADASPPEGNWFQVTGSPDHPITRHHLPLAILAATFISYAGTLALGFVFDDHILIESNASIRSWRYFPGYFASHIWSFRYPHLLANYYRPLFLTWLRLNDALFGLHPWGWHLTSVLGHVAVTYLVFLLALRLTRDGWTAGAAGLIFGLHPVHVEAVADITSIQEPLSTLFILATVLTSFAGRRSKARFRWIAASLLCMAAALLSKESGMVLPVLIMGLAAIYGSDGGREVAPQSVAARLRAGLATSVPYWAVLAIYVLLRIWALKGFAHLITPLPLSQVVFTIPSVLLFYLRLLIWPSGLSCYYDTPYISGASRHGFILPAGLLVMVVAAGIFGYSQLRRSSPHQAKAVVFAAFWMILTLLPVLNFRLLPVGEIAHDRYVYLPSVGFAILAAMALRRAMGAQTSWGTAITRPRTESNRRPVAVLAGVLLLSAAMGYATVRQSLFWADDLTLNNRAHQIAPLNVSATTSLAAAVANRGMDSAAMALYQQALAVQPQFWRANVNLAYLYYAHGNFASAAEYFRRACAADPVDGDQFLYLGMSLLRTGRATEAEQALRTALLVRPEGKNYHLGLGMVLRGEGKRVEARQEVEKELSADPQNVQAAALLKDMEQEIRAGPEKPPSTQVPKSASNAIK